MNPTLEAPVAPVAAIPAVAAIPKILHAVTPWTRLTRYGLPQFRVSRRPLFFNGTTLPVGTIIPTSHLPLQRLRQFHEQRLIVPIPETIVAAPPPGRPAAEAEVPEQVLEQQAMEAASGEGMCSTLFIDDLPGVEALVEVDEPNIASPLAVPAPVQANKSNKANKR